MELKSATASEGTSVNVRRRELLKASVWITGGAAGVVGAAAEAGSGGPRRCDAAAADHDLASLAAAFDRLSWTFLQEIPLASSQRSTSGQSSSTRTRHFACPRPGSSSTLASMGAGCGRASLGFHATAVTWCVVTVDSRRVPSPSAESRWTRAAAPRHDVHDQLAPRYGYLARRLFPPVAGAGSRGRPVAGLRRLT